MKTILSAVILAAACISSGAAGAADPPGRTIFLHYDYMVAPDHSHAPDPRSIELVVEAFRRQGITLHVDPRHAEIPEVAVVTFGPPEPKCAGSDAVSIQDLRKKYLDERDGHDWHYAVFAHRVNTPDLEHQQSCLSDQCGKPNPLAHGTAELPGRNFALAFGAEAEAGIPVLLGFEAATFMHELGHNLGLTHGGSQGDACINYKPNYISVMNYSYQQLANGIPIAPLPGSAEPMTCGRDADCGRGAFCQPMSDYGYRYCVRLDFSDRLLPQLNETTGASGAGGLDESIGVSGEPTDRDIVMYWSGGSLLAGPSFGPIDWNADGIYGGHVVADINGDGGTSSMRGFDDWAFVHATLGTPHYSKAARDPNPSVATCSH